MKTLKVSRENALPVGFDTGLGELEKLTKTKDVVPADNKGNVVDFEVNKAYIEFQKQYLTDLSNLKIGLDCSNGMAGLLIKDLLGEQPLYLFDEMDGTFPNHEPNPLVEKNVEDLKTLVKKEQCDVGVIFDCV